MHNLCRQYTEYWHDLCIEVNNDLFVSNQGVKNAIYCLSLFIYERQAIIVSGQSLLPVNICFCQKYFFWLDNKYLSDS